MNDYSSVFVILMGLGTVFFGLTCLIALTTIMGRVLGRYSAAPALRTASAVPQPAAIPVEPNRTELLAAVSAAVAEALGTDVTGIRILSMKKL